MIIEVEIRSQPSLDVERHRDKVRRLSGDDGSSSSPGLAIRAILIDPSATRVSVYLGIIGFDQIGASDRP